MGKLIAGQPRGPVRRRAIWDVVMVTLALVDLGFIGFDLTYLYLRPVYLDVAPGLVSLYDPVKGMRPHPTSQRLLEQMQHARELLTGPSSENVSEQMVAEQAQVLRHLSLRVLREDAFGRSGDAALEDVLREIVGQEVGVDPADLAYPPVQYAAVEELWPPDRARLLERLQRPEGTLVQALAANYFRDVGLDGEPVDLFLWLELPLLALFWLDFWLGWLVAARRDHERTWYHYPLTHWYDLLGLLPGKLRLFRLLRLVSLYLRIYRGELRQVRDNVVKRVTLRLAEGLVEEVTNRVQIRVVQRLETELTEHTIQNTLAASVARQQGDIVELVIDQLRHVAADPETQHRARELVLLATEEVLQSRRRWPFARDLTRSVAERTATAALDALAHTLQSAQGQATLRSLLMSASARAQGRPSFQQLQNIASDISLDVVRAVGEAAHNRTWTAPASARPSAVQPPPQSGSRPVSSTRELKPVPKTGSGH